MDWWDCGRGTEEKERPVGDPGCCMASLIDLDHFYLAGSLSLKYPLVKPVVTPRFAVSCSGALLGQLGEIARNNDLHIQVSRVHCRAFDGKMPNTRSKGQAQPTLQYPRRKSIRASCKAKSSPPPEEQQQQPPAELKTRIQFEDRLLGPLSPRMSTNKTMAPLRLGPLSPRKANPLSPCLTTRLPLSPRKRTGDENGCNFSANVMGSPPKQSRPTLLGSPRKLVLDENSMNFTTTILSSHRGGLGSPRSPKQPLTPPSRALPSRCQEALSGSLTCQSPEKKPPVKSLFSERSKYQGVKQALHTAVPERLLSRETERASIRAFLEQQVLKALPSSLYISGAPGTGKTACLNCVLKEMKDELKPVKTVVVNCMTLRSSHAIFPLLADRLGAPGSHTDTKLQKLLTSSGPPVLLVLDEMDQLDSKAQDVLYTIFEWPYLPKSRLCLIGIANALDLTDRILPRLQALPRCRPQLLNFPPYSRQELTAIVQDRMTQVSGEGMLDAAAVQFCARKVSAVSGDARKALDICRRAVEMVEADVRKKAAMPTADGKVMRVSVPQVARVLSEVYGDRMSSTGGGEGESLPLQQKLLVCCLLLLTRTGSSKEVPLGKLHEVHSRLCTKRQVGGVGQGECLSLCGLLESRGIFALKKAKETRLTKVFLKIEEKDVENALKDRALLGSILEAGLP